MPQVQCKTTGKFGEALLLADCVPVLEVTVLVAEDVDDGPLTTCEVVDTTLIVVNGIGIVVIRAEVVGGTEPRLPSCVAFVALVAIVTVGIPGMDPHILSNESMRLCVEETTLIEGSAAMKQLTQACRLSAMAALHMQLTAPEGQLFNDVWKGVQVALHGESVCRGRISSNESRITSR